ncbi:MAG: RNA polymerase sigma factor [Fulvivirga sp.]|uniref:RNA polymerase sigma factor n=1 Tax=Fulvivirga sp. TaxID=1931237 RepID=UPI0032ECC8BF
MTEQKSSILPLSMTQHQEETIKNQQGKLLGFIKSKVNNIEDAEDILQDVLEQFVDSTSAIESIEKASSWLYRVAGNKIIDLYRFKKVRSNQVIYTIENNEEDTPLLLKDILPDLDGTPEDQYFQDILWEEITLALDRLPAEQREVFVLHEIEDLSFKEIEKKLNVPVNTLLSRKRYAVLALRKKLEDLYNDL